MQIGVPKETADGERRVAIVPELVKKITSSGGEEAAEPVEILVEREAGANALIPDSQYEEAGARLADDVWEADVVVKVAPPNADETQRVRQDSILIGFLQPLTNAEGVRALAQTGATTFALESVPRISRAQSMDALSSQSNVAGYRAALIGAQALGRFYPMLMTAAGTIRPATVLVLGVGVAGLQAIATARRLGAIVQGFDVRPEVADQVRSLGATWLEVGPEASGEGGYARELTEDERAQQQQALQEAIGKVDVVITTALVPGRRAPILVTEEAVQKMKPGSVIVDLAGEAGGNCEVSEPGQEVIRYDVKVLAPLNVPSTMAEHASQLYARNIEAFLGLMISDGKLNLDFDDEIISGACITRDGEIVNERAKQAASQGAPTA
jgi:H+-translocating NAD(P) transhydrogenase subunit alpha